MIEVRPAMEQRTMTLLVAPKAVVMQKVQTARAQAAKALRKDRPEDRELARQDADVAKFEQQLADAEDEDDEDDDEDEAKE